MSIELTRRSVSKIAKLDFANLTHCQRLDAIAEALGYDNQAAMMATMKPRKKGEKPIEERFQSSDFLTSLRLIIPSDNQVPMWVREAMAAFASCAEGLKRRPQDIERYSARLQEGLAKSFDQDVAQDIFLDKLYRTGRRPILAELDPIKHLWPKEIAAIEKTVDAFSWPREPVKSKDSNFVFMKTSQARRDAGGEAVKLWGGPYEEKEEYRLDVRMAAAALAIKHAATDVHSAAFGNSVETGFLWMMNVYNRMGYYNRSLEPDAAPEMEAAQARYDVILRAKPDEDRKGFFYLHDKHHGPFREFRAAHPLTYPAGRLALETAAEFLMLDVIDSVHEAAKRKSSARKR